MSTNPDKLAICQIIGYFCRLDQTINKRLQSYMI